MLRWCYRYRWKIKTHILGYRGCHNEMWRSWITKVSGVQRVWRICFALNSWDAASKPWLDISCIQANTLSTKGPVCHGRAQGKRISKKKLLKSLNVHCKLRASSKTNKHKQPKANRGLPWTGVKRFSFIKTFSGTAQTCWEYSKHDHISTRLIWSKLPSTRRWHECCKRGWLGNQNSMIQFNHDILLANHTVYQLVLRTTNASCGPTKKFANQSAVMQFFVFIELSRPLRNISTTTLTSKCKCITFTYIKMQSINNEFMFAFISSTHSIKHLTITHQTYPLSSFRLFKMQNPPPKKKNNEALPSQTR